MTSQPLPEPEIDTPNTVVGNNFGTWGVNPGGVPFADQMGQQFGTPGPVANQQTLEEGFNTIASDPAVQGTAPAPPGWGAGVGLTGLGLQEDISAPSFAGFSSAAFGPNAAYGPNASNPGVGTIADVPAVTETTGYGVPGFGNTNNYGGFGQNNPTGFGGVSPANPNTGAVPYADQFGTVPFASVVDNPYAAYASVPGVNDPGYGYGSPAYAGYGGGPAFGSIAGDPYGDPSGGFGYGDPGGGYGDPSGGYGDPGGGYGDPGGGYGDPGGGYGDPGGGEGAAPGGDGSGAPSSDDGSGAPSSDDGSGSPSSDDGSGSPSGDDGSGSGSSSDDD